MKQLINETGIIIVISIGFWFFNIPSISWIFIGIAIGNIISTLQAEMILQKQKDMIKILLKYIEENKL